MHFVIGFKGFQRGDPGDLLYCGSSRGDAVKAMKSPKNGYVRTELYSNVKHTQRKFHEVTKPGKKKAKK